MIIYKYTTGSLVKDQFHFSDPRNVYGTQNYSITFMGQK